MKFTPEMFREPFAAAIKEAAKDVMSDEAFWTEVDSYLQKELDESRCEITFVGEPGVMVYFGQDTQGAARFIPLSAINARDIAMEIMRDWQRGGDLREQADECTNNVREIVEKFQAVLELVRLTKEDIGG